MLKKIFTLIFYAAIAAAYQCPDVNIQIFPKDNPWNWNITKAEVHKFSEEYINSLGPDNSLKPWFGTRLGIPYSLVAGGKDIPVEFTGRRAETGKMTCRIPPDAPKELGSDSRVIVIDTNNHNLYELFQAEPDNYGEWSAYSGAVFNLDTNALRKERVFSADPAGMAIFPGLARFQDITRGEMNHAVRVVVPDIDSRYVYPARNSPVEKSNEKPDPTKKPEVLPAMGQRFRLKNETDITKLGVQSQIIAAGLKKHGFIVADHGFKPYCFGTMDERWDDKDLATLAGLKMSDFEAIVEITSLNMSALDPYEKVKLTGAPFIRGKKKAGILNVPAGKITIRIMDAKKVMVKELENKGVIIAWDLKDASGKDVDPGDYTIVIEDPKRILKELPVKVE